MSDSADHSKSDMFQEEPKKSRGRGLNDYLDRRAQAASAKDSKNDILSNPNPGIFSNRYLDLKSTASRGRLLDLPSGGLLVQDRKILLAKMQSAYQDQEQMIPGQQKSIGALMKEQFESMGLPEDQQTEYTKQYQDAYDTQLDAVPQNAGMIESVSLSRRITKNILLMIVKMPTEPEMTTTRGQLGASPN